MKFYDNKGSHVNKNTCIDSDCTDDRQSSSSDMECSSPCDNEFDCGRAKGYNLCNKSKVKTSMPIKSQIVIMSSREMPPSSDESDTIDVGSDSVQGLFGNIKVEPVPVKIVDDLIDNNLDDTDEMIIVMHTAEAKQLNFNPLTDEDRHVAALKFSLIINGNSHPVHNKGIGMALKSPPTVTITAHGNGACLFNSMSLLLCGRDTYSAIIRHVICNYIDNPVKHVFLKPFIPEKYEMGKKYTTSTRMRNFTTWGTELEIITFV